MQEGATLTFAHTRGPLAKRQEAICAETTGLALAILAPPTSSFRPDGVQLGFLVVNGVRTGGS